MILTSIKTVSVARSVRCLCFVFFFALCYVVTDSSEYDWSVARLNNNVGTFSR